MMEVLCLYYLRSYSLFLGGSIPFALWDGGKIIYKDLTQTTDNHGPHKLPKAEKKTK